MKFIQSAFVLKSNPRTIFVFDFKDKHPKTSDKNVQEKDVAVQTPPLLDPTQWTGNQRVVHFGPMAQRDPFYYYYPKGWDILYPAHFGFFPYRTTKSRGSSPIVCFVAFGVFFTLGGLSMTYLGYSDVLKQFAVGTLQPLRVKRKTFSFCFASAFKLGQFFYSDRRSDFAIFGLFVFINRFDLVAF